jgi:hypothetical protein
MSRIRTASTLLAILITLAPYTVIGAELTIEPYYAGHVYEFESEGTAYRLVYLGRSYNGADLWIARLPFEGFASEVKAITLANETNFSGTVKIRLLEIDTPRTYTTNMTLLSMRAGAWSNKYTFEIDVPLWSSTYDTNEQFVVDNDDEWITKLTFIKGSNFTDWQRERYNIEIIERTDGLTIKTDENTYPFSFDETHEVSFTATPLRISIEGPEIRIQEEEVSPQPELSMFAKIKQSIIVGLLRLFMR